MTKSFFAKHGALIFIIALSIFVIGAIYLRNRPEQLVAVENPSQLDGQIVKLGLRNGNYYPPEITVESGKKVTLQNDGTLAGCALYVSQPELGIIANFARNKEYSFTPNKKGSYIYTCSMGMFRGTLNIL